MATKTANPQGASNLKITLTRGLVAKMETHRKVVKALGLSSFGSTVIHSDSPTIRGMVRKISHLLTVEPTSEAPPAKPHARHNKKKGL